MKGGTTQTQQTSQTDTSNIKKPTAEQIRYAQLLNNEDLKVVQDQIKQVADFTGRSSDEVSVALHDCNYDTEQAINTLLEGSADKNEWITSSSRKKKHQVTGQGVDNIISSGQPTREGQRQSRGGRGGRNRTSEKNWELDQKDNDENKPPESGRGRGIRDDRSADRKPSGGRGGLSRRGRGGSRGRSSSRGRGGKIGRNGISSTQPMNNGPTENGTEMWDIPDPNDDKNKTESWEDSAKPSDNWGTEDYIHLPSATVKEPVAPVSMSSLFSSSVQQSNNWSNNDAKEVSSWGNSDSDSATVTGNNGPLVRTTREQSTENTPFAPESVDMAIIHSKIAQSPSRTSEQSQSNTDMPMIRIPLPAVNHNHLGPISKLLDNVSAASLPQQPMSSVSHVTSAQPQRQSKQNRTRKSQKSQIPQKPVEMPDSMMDELDVQFGNLEFGGDFGGSPGKGQSKESAVTFSSEEHLVSKQNDLQVSRPIEAESISNLPSTLSRSVPITIASTTSATSSLTSLEDSSPRHYQHASPRERKSQPRDLSEDTLPAQVPDRSRTPPAVSASNDNSSLGAVTRSLPISSATLQSQLVSSLPKESALDSRVYQVNQHVSSQPLSSKDKLSSSNLAHHSTLGGSTMVTSSQRSESSSSHTIQPPPGVGVPHSTTQQATSSLGLSTATVSSSNRPAQHSGKPSLPPGVLPMSTLYGIQQPGMMPAYSMPFNYEELQRQMQMAAYYDMMQAQAPLQGRDNLQGTYQADQQKFGRSDASSPVQTTMNQANQGQHHLQQQQQAYLNTGTMPPYGYGGLAFYPGGVMPGGFPTYSGPQMYQQMAPKTHGNVSQYQPAYGSQHGNHHYSSGYDDLNVGHDFGKSPYHSVSQTQSKSTSVVSTSTDLGGGSSYKTQIGKYGESKGFLGGTPPPALNLSVQGQHSHLGNFPGHTTPFMSMLPTQQQHPHSLFHHHPVPHQDVGQTGMSQRGQQSQLSKQSQNKGGHQGSYPGPFWSNANKS
ncbi:ubiquitin-associated protein 2-like isoform X2 [Actinia tenebrosa]|uniref:Ubiquitin-associated protein 2-like isoform X2 n=1 Tax=Actinia tenebrosa TaxID=6105 RepID=A0A6P8HZL9_ACTTE|nr:ubiquitin-associated protein 2-like isoform X2 [Actinia tenebrosa]